MKKNQSAFTLIELLVVITIIAILASIALPVFNGVTERANQTKDLSNAKQIGLAARLFAADNNGDFPSKKPGPDYTTATALAVGDKSNDAFWWLFPNYLQSEDIFVIGGSKWSTGADNKIDPATVTTRVDTTVAMALALSCHPLEKSKSNASATTTNNSPLSSAMYAGSYLGHWSGLVSNETWRELTCVLRQYAREYSRHLRNDRSPLRNFHRFLSI